jgi:hypothetical protein
VLEDPDPLYVEDESVSSDWASAIAALAAPAGIKTIELLMANINVMDPRT